MPFYGVNGVNEIGQSRFEPLAAGTVGGLPDRDDRFADGRIVDALSHHLPAISAGSTAQQPDAVLGTVAGYRRELIENPAFVPLGCLLVPVPDSRHKFLLRDVADASAHVAASRILGSILVEATTYEE